MAVNAQLAVFQANGTFNYGDLPKPDVKALEQHAEAIEVTQQHVRRVSAEGVIALGKELKAAQERLAGQGRDGLFNPWVKERCGFSHMTAYRAIAACKTFSKSNNLLHFDASALYLLSADSTPQAATNKALRLAEKGERISHKRAKEIKKEYVEEEEKEFNSQEAGIKLCDAIRKQLEKWPGEEMHVAIQWLRYMATDYEGT